MLLDKFQLPPTFLRNNKECYLDPIRKMLIQVTPEEIVRQQMISYLQEDLGVPYNMILVEEPLSHYKKGAQGRADIIVHREENNVLYPLILIECKSSTVELTDKVFKQAARYDEILLADVMVITNGLYTEWYAYKEDEDKYLLLSKVPTYNELVEKRPLEYDLTPPYIWKRPIFEKLKLDETYQEFMESGWIGEDTRASLRPFIMNLLGCFQDTSVMIDPYNYDKINIIKDGGIRFTTFGNSAGGRWDGEYRYLLLNDEFGSTQIISFSIFGQLKAKDHPTFGNIKGNSILIVAIDDFDKSHNSLQLNLDLYTKELDEDQYIIWHDGKLTNGSKGRVSFSAVINFIKEHEPDLLDDNDKVYLGKFKNTENLNFSQPDMQFFLERVVRYALVRDKFRKMNS